MQKKIHKNSLANLHRFQPSVRKVNGLEIYFRDKWSIVLKYSGGSIVLFRDHQRRYYHDVWRPFCEKLRRKNGIYGIYDVMKLVADYDIAFVSLSRSPEIPRNIKVING